MSQEEIIGLLGTTRFRVTKALGNGTARTRDLSGCEKCGAMPYAQVPSLAGGPRRCGGCGAHYRNWAGGKQEVLPATPQRKRSAEDMAAERDEIRLIIDRGRENTLVRARAPARVARPFKPPPAAYTAAEIEARKRAVSAREEELKTSPPPPEIMLLETMPRPAGTRGRPEKACGTVLRLSVLRDERQPVTRGDCVGGQRPCPWDACRHHLLLAPSCALDVVDANPVGVTLEVVGDLLGVTRERIRQIEEKALRKLRLAFGPDAIERLLSDRIDRAG